MASVTDFEKYFGKGWAVKARQVLGIKSKTTFYRKIKKQDPEVMNYITPMLDAYTEEQKEAIIKFTHSKEKADLIKDVSNSLKQKVS